MFSVLQLISISCQFYWAMIYKVGWSDASLGKHSLFLQRIGLWFPAPTMAWNSSFQGASTSF